MKYKLEHATDLHNPKSLGESNQGSHIFREQIIEFIIILLVTPLCNLVLGTKPKKYGKNLAIERENEVLSKNRERTQNLRLR